MLEDGTSYCEIWGVRGCGEEGDGTSTFLLRMLARFLSRAWKFMRWGDAGRREVKGADCCWFNRQIQIPQDPGHDIDAYMGWGWGRGREG